MEVFQRKNFGFDVFSEMPACFGLVVTATCSAYCCSYFSLGDFCGSLGSSMFFSF